ncbi:hypothetical protein C8J56DRAFT_894335 [Mycena floridula]|nr:hypothetical protein C8J56DRAFT_894335 [Mycena floridula]
MLVSPSLGPGIGGAGMLEVFAADDAGEREDEKDVEEMDVETEETVKRKQYESSDNPMAGWIPLRQHWLCELLHSDGLGDDIVVQKCNICQASLDGANKSPFRCLCCSLSMVCQWCLLKEHQLLPLHCIQKWIGAFWGKTSLCSKGLTYQLGHGGYPCPVPGKEQLMTLIGGDAIQKVQVAWCSSTMVNPQTCATFDCLDQFHTMNVVGNMNVQDFVMSLEMLTDRILSSKVADRYRSFGRMSCQFSFLLHMKHTGRGHCDEGIARTRSGEAAVQCWTCPHDGINLPDSWKDVHKSFRSDPVLTGGMGYQVPDLEYWEFLKSYISEEDYVVNLEERSRLLPPDLTPDLEATKIRTALPIWHGDIHYLKCRSQNLVQYQQGAGKTDGEGIERMWSKMNEISYRTKEMGEETCADAIEDRLDHHNHEKNAKLALVQEQIQLQEFEEVNSTLMSEVQEAWVTMYDAWEENRKENLTPFALTIEDRVSEAQVRLMLKEDEVEEARKSQVLVHVTSASSFLGVGLELEEAQRWIWRDIKEVMSTSEKAKMEVWRQTYMPGAVRGVIAAEEARNSDEVPLPMENMKLWLPSEMSGHEQIIGCKWGLATMEVKLWEVQCTDALKQVSEAACMRAPFDQILQHPYEEFVLDAAATKKLRQIGSQQTSVHSSQQGKVGAMGTKGKKLSWIWTTGITGDTDDEIHIMESVRVEWAKACARKERWSEEVLILKEEM